jgi:DNA-binding transcriptional LysR family regulator
LRIGPLPDSSLVSTTIGQIRQVVCASPAYLKLHGTPKRPADLARHDCITFDSALNAKSWVFGTGKSKVDVRLRSRLSVNTAEAAVDAALAGAGITRVLSYQMAAAAEANKLKTLLRDFEPAPWPVNLVYAEQGQLPLKLRAFIDFAAPRLRESLAQ